MSSGSVARRSRAPVPGSRRTHSSSRAPGRKLWSNPGRNCGPRSQPSRGRMRPTDRNEQGH
eukprot:7767521-Alexandrium_andersonii.AAC.1